MPSILCRCGETLVYGDATGPNEWLIASGFESDARSGVVYVEILQADRRGMLKCIGCERVWVFWNGYENAPVAYALERE